MPQGLEEYLRSLNTSDRVRAAAWDAVYAKDDAEAESRLRAILPLSDDVRAVLWDARKGVTPQPVTEPVAPQPESAGSRFVSNAASALNPIAAARGIVEAMASPGKTLDAMMSASGQQLVKAGEAWDRGGIGGISEAVGHAVAGSLPLIGPAAASAGEQIAGGDVAGGLGGSLGLVMGAGLAGPAAKAASRLARPLTTRAAEMLYQSALKPTKAVLKDVRTPAGAGPDAARRTLVQTGLREEIPVSGRGARKVESLVDSLNSEVEARLSRAEARGLTVDPAYVDTTIRDVAADFTNQVNAQPDLAAIQTVRENFATNPNVAQPIQPTPQGAAPQTAPGPIPIQTAQAMKRNTYKGLRGKYGVERGATIEAEKAGARGLKEQIETQAPDIKALNAREGSLIPLDEAIADAMRRRGNYGIFGLTPIVASVPAITHGNLWPLLLSLADRAPGVVSRSGIWINRAGRATGKTSQRAARTAVVGNRVGVSDE